MSDSDDEEDRDIVIDLGSGMIKAGFSGEDDPAAVFPTIVARPKVRSMMVGADERTSWVYDGRRRMVNVHYPIQNGIVTSWDDMLTILKHTFYNELRVAPEEHRVMLTESPDNPKHSREKITQVMFETYGARAMFLVPGPVLALLSTGYSDGIVLDSGNTVTNAVPICDGQVLSYASQRSRFGGEQITDRVIELVKEQTGIHLSTSAEREIARDIKEKMTHVALDYEAELHQYGDDKKLYELPDGQCLEISRAVLMQAPEALFNPSAALGDSVPATCTVCNTHRQRRQQHRRW